MKASDHKQGQKIRYAVVGLGYIAQVAVLPAFEHASSNSELTALVSNDGTKLKKLGWGYDVKDTYTYDHYEDCLRSGNIDAVYIALPNKMHREYAVKAAEAGIHVLCEKPMAVTEKECLAMIRAAKNHQVKLMVAYRLHFEAANLSAIEIVKSGKLGDPRFFISSFSQQVKKGDIRLQDSLGGGSLYDMGIYCINAARYIFQAEPREVFASSAHSGDPRFLDVDEMTSVMMRFPGERLASFTSSFGAVDTSYYRIVGTDGDLVLEPAYDYSIGLQHRLTINGMTHERKFPKTDQFGPELAYFSDCILKNKKPEPSGEEGRADVRIIEALYKSAASHKWVSLSDFDPGARPSPQQTMKRPPIRQLPEMVHAASPSGV